MGGSLDQRLGFRVRLEPETGSATDGELVFDPDPPILQWCFEPVHWSRRAEAVDGQGVSAAFVVEKIFFTVVNGLVYGYVVAGILIANATAATPGGAGVNQAISAVALARYTDAQTATAFSVTQQLVTTAWSIVLAVIMVLTVFGWTNGRALVKSAYTAAKARAAERSERPNKADGAPMSVEAGQG